MLYVQQYAVILKKTLPLIENYFLLNKKYKKENAENPMVVHPYLGTSHNARYR